MVLDVKFHFEVIGDFDSKDLWEKIQSYGVNLFDAIGHVYVYGTTSEEALNMVLHMCKSFGFIKGGELYEGLLHSSAG